MRLASNHLSVGKMDGKTMPESIIVVCIVELLRTVN